MRKNVNQKRGTRKQLQNILIICEGEKTEPQYFKSFIPADRVASDVRVFIRGDGYNTMSLVDSAIEEKRKFSVGYDKVYVVFDCDGFPKFNEAITRAQNEGMIPIWSNDAFELWFVLHAKHITASQPRDQYARQISSFIGQKYDKSTNNMRELLNKQPTTEAKQKGISNEEVAIQRAKQLAEQAQEEYGSNYAKQNPCTMVYALVEELRRLFED